MFANKTCTDFNLIQVIYDGNKLENFLEMQNRN